VYVECLAIQGASSKEQKRLEAPATLFACAGTNRTESRNLLSKPLRLLHAYSD
jgi:hypothetical protein